MRRQWLQVQFSNAAPVLFIAEWDEGGSDEVPTGTSVENLISMRIMWEQWRIDVESARSPYQ